MDTVSIIQEIDAEISCLQQARAILASTEDKRVAGRPKLTQALSSPVEDEPTKRVMSVEGKAKIAEAQKARWAKSKRADKKAAKKAALAKTTPAKKVAKKPVKLAKPVKATKLVKEDKPETQG
jgi:hypothetical protein